VSVIQDTVKSLYKHCLEDKDSPCWLSSEEDWWAGCRTFSWWCSRCAAY